MAESIVKRYTSCLILIINVTGLLDVCEKQDFWVIAHYRVHCICIATASGWLRPNNLARSFSRKRTAVVLLNC